MIKVTLDQLLD